MAGKLLFWPAFFSSLDEKLMWRVRTDDDAQAFAALVERWQPSIQRLCTRMTGNPHQGEDLAQETFARLFARRKDYEPTGRFAIFLWRMTVNICYDELRKLHRRKELPLERPDSGADDGPFEFPAHDPGPDRLLVANERALAVQQAISELPESHRLVVILRHYEGLKFREIGDVLGIPEGTAKRRMFDGLAQLTRRLNPLIADETKLPNPFSRPTESLLI